MILFTKLNNISVFGSGVSCALLRNYGFSKIFKLTRSNAKCFVKVTNIKPANFHQECLVSYQSRKYTNKMSDNEDKRAELKRRLTPLQYHVTQEKGTERAFTGKYNKHYGAGTYSCIVCQQPLFSSETKYDAGCGWPAFNDVLDAGKIKLSKDTSAVGANLLLLIANPGMIRTEVTCAKCGAHLGHVFNDGPVPKRKRFCINSASLDFHPAGETENS